MTDNVWADFNKARIPFSRSGDKITCTRHNPCVTFGTRLLKRLSCVRGLPGSDDRPYWAEVGPTTARREVDEIAANVVISTAIYKTSNGAAYPCASSGLS